MMLYHSGNMLNSLLPEQFTEFYYNQFDADRKQLAALYVCSKKSPYNDAANGLKSVTTPC